MKVNFSKEQEYVPVWNKNKELPEVEQLVAHFTILTMGELLDTIAALGEVGFEKGEAKDMTPAQMQKVLVTAGKYVVKHTKLTGNDGFTIEDVVSYSTFFALAIDLLFQLVNISSPTDQDVKN